jgi:hypothetical protein
MEGPHIVAGAPVTRFDERPQKLSIRATTFVHHRSEEGVDVGPGRSRLDLRHHDDYRIAA